MDSDITFEEYLKIKLIDSEKFQLDEPDKYESLKQVFDQMHPDSFTAQKLFLINPIRRRYTLNVVESKPEIKDVPKPKLKIKAKIKR